MVPQRDSSIPKHPRNVALRASTVLLALALCGFLLRLGGGGQLLGHVPSAVTVVLLGMAPIWALMGSVLATIYLVFTVWRPYSAAQHLVEMVAGVVLMLLMLPVV